MIHQALEGSINWLQSIRPEDLPHPLPGGVTIHLRGGEVGVEARNVVGAIPLRNGDTLHITPKIGTINFLRLLFRAEGMQRNLEREYDEFVRFSVDEERNVDYVVARQLILSVAEILRRGELFGRIRKRRVGTFAAGQVDLLATVGNLARRKEEPVVCFVKERTVNTIENGLLSEALVRSWSLLDRESQDSFRGIRNSWLRRNARPNDVRESLAVLEQRFALGWYGGPRDYYRRALMLARIALGSQGLAFDGAATVEGDSVVLNSADLFEKYVRNVIAAAHLPKGIVVSKGGVGVRSLYLSGKFELVPDVVISQSGRALLIADAKYKEEPSADDHYQLHAYLRDAELQRGLLIAPLFEGVTPVVRDFVTAQGVVVSEVYLPMADLSATEAFLGRVIERFA